MAGLSSPDSGGRQPLYRKSGSFWCVVWSGARCSVFGMTAEKKPQVDLGLLEEDDEFEEFPTEDWTGCDEDEDAHVWEDNWDDDNVEDDFSNQLRAELEKHGYKIETRSREPADALTSAPGASWVASVLKWSQAHKIVGSWLWPVLSQQRTD